jgi:transposase
VLRTDGHRPTLTPDSAQTVALRSVVHARTDLVEPRVAMCNQLRAHLRVVFLAVVGLLADLDSPISLAFLTRFPTVDKAAWLSQRLGAWLAANSYCGCTPTAVRLELLDTGPDGLPGDAGAAAAHTTMVYVTTLIAIRTQIPTLDVQIRGQLATHLDGHIFTIAAPQRTGPCCQLLFESGDARGPLRTDAALPAFAGARPSTRQSGRHYVVPFRWACDIKLRAAVNRPRR